MSLCTLNRNKVELLILLVGNKHLKLKPIKIDSLDWENTRSVGHFNKTVFNSGSVKLGESQGLGESLRLSPILGESLKLSPKIGESFRWELFKMKELWHFFTYVQNSPQN